MSARGERRDGADAKNVKDVKRRAARDEVAAMRKARIVRATATMKRRGIGRAGGWLAGGAAMLVAAGGGCLQILGDDATFVLGTGGAGGESGGAGPGGNGGGTAGSGATGGGGTTSTGACSPGETRSCYSGPDGTEGVGECKAGVETCAGDGSDWGECQGEVTPQPEDPTVAGDEGCDGYLPGEVLCSGVFGGPNEQIVSAIAVDLLTGDVFIAGSFKGSPQFGDSTLVATGFLDVFVAKLDSSCNPQWAVQFKGSQDDYARDIAVDKAGNLIVVGGSYGSVEIGGQTVEASTFIAKLARDTGERVWAAGCGGDSQSNAWAVGVDDDDDILVAGVASGSINCGDGPLQPIGSQDAFVAHLAGSNGAAIWTKRFGGAMFDTVSAESLEVDPVGSLILSGSFIGTAQLGGGALLGKGAEDFFVAKLASDGTHLWSTSFGSPGNQRSGSLAVDKLGAVAVAGRFANTLDLPGEPSLTSVNGSDDAFVLKLDSSGQVEWGRALGDSLAQAATGVAFDAEGQVIVTGMFNGTLDFGPAQLQAAGDANLADGFVAKVSGTDGAHIWSKSFADSSSFVSRVSVDADGNVALAVSSDEPIDFGAGPSAPVGADSFMCRLAP